MLTHTTTCCKLREHEDTNVQVQAMQVRVGAAYSEAAEAMSEVLDDAVERSEREIKMSKPITIEEIAYHRNGVSGAGFYVVKFIDADVTKPKTRLIDKVNEIQGAQGKMIGIVFDAPYHVAVFDRGLLAQDVIAFSANSWRGDHYETALRKACESYGKFDWIAHGQERAIKFVNEALR